MCRRVICTTCKKFTYAGCGNHIQEALKGLTKEQICNCSKKQSTTTQSTKDTNIKK